MGIILIQDKIELGQFLPRGLVDAKGFHVFVQICDGGVVISLRAMYAGLALQSELPNKKKPH